MPKTPLAATLARLPPLLGSGTAAPLAARPCTEQATVGATDTIRERDAASGRRL